MKKLFSLLLMIALVLSLSGTVAYANDYYGDSDWNVTFTREKRMEDDFGEKEGDFLDNMNRMQPGDTVTLTVHLKNEYPASTDWYIDNQVTKSLETNSANSATAGGAYSYVLSYSGPGGDRFLFNSDSVGGEGSDGAGEGLKQAADSMENYSFLDTLGSGDSASVKLVITLEGESQGNDYQDTLANLRMRFATMLRENDTRSTPNPRAIVRTGDESDLFLYIGVFGVSGLFVLLLAVYALTYNNRKKKKGEEKK